MRIHMRLKIVVALLLTAGAVPAAAGKERGAVMTGFSVLVGFPSGDDSASSEALLVPGTVIPVGAPAAAPEARRELVERRVAFNDALRRLWETFRLDPKRRLEHGAYREAAIERPVALPVPPGSDLDLTATLLGYDQGTTTYRVAFRQKDKVLADTKVNVARGGRAVVGGLGGEAAPYVFVVVEPDPPGGGPNAVRLREATGLSEPHLVARVQPAYPAEAQGASIQGLVILDAVIDLDGSVADIRVISSPGPFLVEAAIEAVRQWRFEPARSASGEPVKVLYAVTINFKLQ